MRNHLQSDLPYDPILHANGRPHAAERMQSDHLRICVLRLLPVFAMLVLASGFCNPAYAQQALRNSPCATRNAGTHSADPSLGTCADAADSSTNAKAIAGRPAVGVAGGGTIGGTVFDSDGAIIPGATAVLEGASPEDRREAMANETGAFEFDGVRPGSDYRVTVSAKGFSTWTSPSIAIEPSGFQILQDVRLKMEVESSSVTVYASSEQIAVEQVRLEEQQRVFGIIPNFYVVYDAANAVPLTPKLKFRLAFKVMTDPVTIAGIGMMAGINQAANVPNFQQGLKGYGQRFGAEAAGGASDILIGGAILPTLLHQDPRYFYQGTGGTRSRLAHALSSPFICRGDNGNRQINFSTIGGDLGATALSMAYYPSSNRGAEQVFTTFGINTAERVIGAMAQEFLIPRLARLGKRTR